MPDTAQYAHTRFAANAPCRIMNSPMKPLSSGSPMEARKMMRVTVA